MGQDAAFELDSSAVLKWRSRKHEGLWVGSEEHVPPICWDGNRSGLLLAIWICDDTALILVLSYFQDVSSNFHEKRYILS